MAKVKLKVLSKSHGLPSGGGVLKRGDEFEGDESLLEQFSNAFEKVEPKTTEKKPKADK